MLLASAVHEPNRIHPSRGSRSRNAGSFRVANFSWVRSKARITSGRRIGCGWTLLRSRSIKCVTGTLQFFSRRRITQRPRSGTFRNFNHPEQPVVAVSWIEAAKYCDWLSGLTGRRYRLPTEAEWERAARGGLPEMLYPWGDQPPEARPEYQRRWGGEVRGPLPVGQGEANPFGIYDLCENVHEWCSDWFQDDYYAVSPARNPRGPESGDRRSSRGGSWRHHVKASRCAARSSIPPHFQYADYGFRVVREVS